MFQSFENQKFENINLSEIGMYSIVFINLKNKNLILRTFSPFSKIKIVIAIQFIIFFFLL